MLGFLSSKSEASRLGMQRIPRRRYLSILFVITVMQAVAVAAAERSSSNIQLLHGSGYELGEDDRTILTFEHTNTWSYGDNYLFLDVTEPGSSGTSLCAEYSPRISLGKLLHMNATTGVIKDTFLATSIEMGEDAHAYLLGVGLSTQLVRGWLSKYKSLSA